MNKQISILAAAITAASLFSSAAQASGFRLNDMSTSGMGTANAGRGALVEDASIVYYNPAGMSKLKQAEFTIGASYIDIHGSFNNVQRTDAAGQSATGFETGGDMFPASTIPFVYYARPLSEKVAIGLGLYVPFGTNSNYGENHVAGAFARETKVTTVALQPTVSYKISDTFAIGLGLDIVYMNGLLSKDLDFGNNPAQGSGPGYENTWEVEGDDTTVGFNVGFMWDVTSSTTLGLTYRSALDFELEGQSRALKESATDKAVLNGVGQLLGGGAAYAREKSNVPLEGPQSASFSLAHSLNDRLNLLATVTWVDWSSFNKLDVNGVDGGFFSSISGLGDDKIGHIDESWRDTYSFSIGADYRLNDQWLLRAGYMFDQTPVSTAHRTARVPDNNRNWFNVGARYSATQNLSFDLAAAYMYMDKSNLNEFNKDLNNQHIENKNPANGQGLGSYQNLTGEYDLNAFGLSLQMNYRM